MFIVLDKKKIKEIAFTLTAGRNEILKNENFF